MDVTRGQMFGLNPVGSRIFLLLEQGSTEADIVSDISELFSTSLEVAATDVREFVNTLVRHELIQQIGEGASQ